MKKGETIHTPLFSLCFLVGATLQVAVVASKKVSKVAVVRNRNKRRVREIFRKHTKHLKKGAYIVFIKRDLTNISYAQLEQEVKRVL